jgi:hypothetical protein
VAATVVATLAGRLGCAARRAGRQLTARPLDVQRFDEGSSGAELMQAKHENPRLAYED